MFLRDPLPTAQIVLWCLFTINGPLLMDSRFLILLNYRRAPAFYHHNQNRAPHGVPCFVPIQPTATPSPALGRRAARACRSPRSLGTYGRRWWRKGPGRCGCYFWPSQPAPVTDATLETGLTLPSLVVPVGFGEVRVNVVPATPAGKVEVATPAA